MVKTRTREIKIRLTDAEHQRLSDRAQTSGLKLAAYLRETGLNVRAPRKPDPGKAELARQIAKIGSNLNQLARWANRFKSTAEAVDVTACLVAIERELSQLNAR